MSTLDNQSRVHFHYPLKPSRLAQFFQWGCLVVMLIFIYMLQHIAIFLLFTVFGCFCLYQQQTRAKTIILLSHLDQSLWSLLYADSQQVQRIQIEKITDYQLYFILSTQQKSHRDVLIWRDQFSRSALKSMKIRAKLS